MKTVGYSNRTRYWQIYAFENPPEGYDYKRAMDIPFHFFRTRNQFLLNTKWMIPFQGCDLYHTYNSIVPIKKPWVVEVESLIPRYGQYKEGDKQFDWGVKKLKSDYCKAIIFTSEYTREMNRENFEKWGIDKKKCHIVYRAVETYEPLERVSDEKEFTILFVGNAFYRKGGVELLRAFNELKKKYKLRLVIVTNFEVDWKVLPTEKEKQFVQNKIKNDNKITVYSNITHQEVISLMRKSDVFVSTTYADPFNNSVLEAMGCGMPVIVSDERAIPEFVTDDYNGFMCSLNLENRNLAKDHIYKSIEMYYNDVNLLKEHGKNGREIVESKFIINQRKKNLKKLYDSILLGEKF